MVSDELRLTLWLATHKSWFGEYFVSIYLGVCVQVRHINQQRCIMVWGGISYTTRIPLVCIEKTSTAPSYINTCHNFWHAKVHWIPLPIWDRTAPAEIMWTFIEEHYMCVRSCLVRSSDRKPTEHVSIISRFFSC